MHSRRTFLKAAVYLVIVIITSTACQSNGPGGTVVVKPRYHHTWYKNHVYKKKWRIGRIKIEPEKQGVKKVRMKG